MALPKLCEGLVGVFGISSLEPSSTWPDVSTSSLNKSLNFRRDNILTVHNASAVFFFDSEDTCIRGMDEEACAFVVVHIPSYRISNSTKHVDQLISCMKTTVRYPARVAHAG